MSGRLFDPFLQDRLLFGQIQKDMLCFFQHRLGFVQFAVGFYQICRIEKLLTIVALVPSSVGVTAVGASAFYESVGQEAIRGRTCEYGRHFSRPFPRQYLRFVVIAIQLSEGFF